MNRFQKPGSEKRSVVILRPDEYGDWLTAKSPDEARSFISLDPAGQCMPRQIRHRRAKPGQSNRLDVDHLDCLIAMAGECQADRASEGRLAIVGGVRPILCRSIGLRLWQWIGGWAGTGRAEHVLHLLLDARVAILIHRPVQPLVAELHA